jgi:hypothetical protein
MTDRRLRIGRLELHYLASIHPRWAYVVPDRSTRRLIEKGLLRSDFADGSFAHITPAGLRALADGAEAGKVKLFEMPKGKQEKADD